MNRVTTTLAIAAAFAAGCRVTHLLRPAYTAETIAAQVIHTGDLKATHCPANAGGMRIKTFVSVDGATISIQDGSAAKAHNANESVTSSKAPERSGSATRK
jgi:hypothetical protein